MIHIAADGMDMRGSYIEKTAYRILLSRPGEPSLSACGGANDQTSTLLSL
ncbi:MAG: hypothetical protein MSA76_10305 [Clostridium sp.]|nr:hypothetical protein [Clostridium sp.]